MSRARELSELASAYDSGGALGLVSQANTTGWYGFGGGGASAVQWKAEVEL